MAILKWEDDADRIVEQLGSTATLKLCVKTLNEDLLIEDWITHHAQIVGHENLIVADNGSSHPSILEVYAKYEGQVTIFQFEGPHNNIHWNPKFAKLFKKIKQTCRYFSFVDADERLVWIDNCKWVADGTIVSKLDESSALSIVPTTWLINHLEKSNSFSLLDSEFCPKFINNLKWGKPILPSNLVGIQDGIHNAQFDRFTFDPSLGCNFFLLHLTQFPQRRIHTNRNKLISRGIIDKSVSSRDVLSIDFTKHLDKSFMAFVEEIRRMYLLIDGVIGAVDDEQTIGGLQLGSDGSVHFLNSDSEGIFTQFLADGQNLIHELFLVSHMEDHTKNPPTSLLDVGLALRRNGRGTDAESIFRLGMKVFPGYADKYNGPAFEKELLRMLLWQERWEEANTLIPAANHSFGAFWHEILFARAYTRSADSENARIWWNKVLEHDPVNTEANEHLYGAQSNQAT